MQLTVRTVKKEEYTIEVETTATILACKEKLTAEKGIVEPSGQRLIYQGRVLTDALTLAEVGVRDTDFLVLMLSAPKPVATSAPAGGGGSPFASLAGAV